MINPYMQDVDPVTGLPGAGGMGGGAPAGGGPPPEIAAAMQTLQQADAFLGQGQGQGGAQPLPGLPGMQQAPQQLPQLQQQAPAPTPAPAPMVMPATLPGQQQAIRQQQFAGLGQGQQLDQQQAGIDQRAGAARVDAAGVQAQLDADKARLADEQAQEKKRLEALYQQEQVNAKAASDKAAAAWTNAKPTDWFDSEKTGVQLVTVLSMALAHSVDAYNAGQGNPNQQVGRQAMSALNQLIDGHRARELARIEELHSNAKASAGEVDKMARERDALVAKLEDKYAGIEKSLELHAKAERSKMGVDTASIENDQLVVERKRRALEAEQRRLDAVNGFVDREMADKVRARKGAGGAGKAPGDPTDPYAGMTPGQRDLATRKDVASEIPNLDGTLAGKARTPEEGKKMRTFQDATNSMIDALGRLKGFIQREGTVQVPLFESSARKERQDLITEIAGYQTVVKNTGVLNQGEFDRYSAVFSPSAWQSSESATANLDKSIAAAEQTYARKVQSQVSGRSSPGANPGEALPTSPAALPAAKPKGTSKFSPQDVQMMQWIQQNPNNPDALEAADYLRKKYGGASGI